MSEKSKKRKRKKSSSVFSDKDEKASKEQCPTKKHKAAKRRHDVNSQVSKRTENNGTRLRDPRASKKKSKMAHSRLDDTMVPSGRRHERASSSKKPPAARDSNDVLWCDQMQVAEELHLARSEKRLEVNVMQSYGELTCMDIDPPEEGATDSLCKQPDHRDLILVLDTNILLSHLDYVKRMRSHGLGALGFPNVVIPWVVLQELDYLKKGEYLSSSVAHLASPAISYIYSSLKNREPHLWGQSMQQAAESTNGLNPENNDDRVLLCCLQYQSLHPGCALILCTNDKNLCSKALLSGVKALSKFDLEEEVGRSRHGLHPLQIPPQLPHICPQTSSLAPSRSSAPVPPHSQKRVGVSVGPTEKDCMQLSEGEDEKNRISRCVYELQDCLQGVLSDVLEKEMIAVYEDLWKEIVYVKPPWTLQDVLHCMKKHWIAVFKFVAPWKNQQIVLNLIDFFKSGKSVDYRRTVTALQEAKELVKAFQKSSSRVPRALSKMDNIFNELQPQPQVEPPDAPPFTSQVSHQDVWSLFEKMWTSVYQLSLEVFKALGFDPHTMRSALAAGGPPPPQDAVVALNTLSSLVSQLQQACSSVLSSGPAVEEVQTLLNIIQSNKIVDVDSRVTPKDLLDCFSQQDYREKLRLGGSQLMELKEALDRCVQSTASL